VAINSADGLVNVNGTNPSGVTQNPDRWREAAQPDRAGDANTTREADVRVWCRAQHVQNVPISGWSDCDHWPNTSKANPATIRPLTPIQHIFALDAGLSQSVLNLFPPCFLEQDKVVSAEKQPRRRDESAELIAGCQNDDVPAAKHPSNAADARKLTCPYDAILQNGRDFREVYILIPLFLHRRQRPLDTPLFDRQPIREGVATPRE
jgi:hypothetical protein